MVQALILLPYTPMALLVLQELIQLGGDAYALLFKRHRQTWQQFSFSCKLCTTYVDPRGIAPLTTSRLIALDKCPGVRPIMIGETSCRIIGKATLEVIKCNILEAAGALQLCAGQEAGSEAAMQCIMSSKMSNLKPY